MEKLMSPSRIATLIDVHRSTVYRWIDEGRVFLPETIIYIAGKPRIPISELNRAIKEGSMSAKDE